jgi:hypothetical protein
MMKILDFAFIALLISVALFAALCFFALSVKLLFVFV